MLTCFFPYLRQNSSSTLRWEDIRKGAADKKGWERSEGTWKKQENQRETWHAAIDWDSATEDDDARGDKRSRRLRGGAQ